MWRNEHSNGTADAVEERFKVYVCVYELQRNEQHFGLFEEERLAETEQEKQRLAEEDKKAKEIKLKHIR